MRRQTSAREADDQWTGAERRAWALYLAQTRSKRGRGYAEIETWAWEELQELLRAIKRARKLAA